MSRDEDKQVERRGIDAFERGDHTRARGNAAEDRGVIWLEGRGYQVVERNVETTAGEIDVVALDGEVLCFVEIKARASSSHGVAVYAVNRRKQLRIGRAAALYLASSAWTGACRFDVLGMDADNGGWKYSLIRDAFELA